MKRVTKARGKDALPRTRRSARWRRRALVLAALVPLAGSAGCQNPGAEPAEEAAVEEDPLSGTSAPAGSGADAGPEAFKITVTQNDLDVEVDGFRAALDRTALEDREAE